MFIAISTGQILAVLVTLNLIGLCFAAFVILRRKSRSQALRRDHRSDKLSSQILLGISAELDR